MRNQLAASRTAPTGGFDALLGDRRGSSLPDVAPETSGPDFGPFTEATRRFIAGLGRLDTPLCEPAWMEDALDGIRVLDRPGEQAALHARCEQFYLALRYAAAAFAGGEPNLWTRKRALKTGLFLVCCPDLLDEAERGMFALAWRAYFPAFPDPQRLS